MITKTNEFDINNKVRIYNLMVLQGEALMRAQFMAHAMGIKPGEPCINFYSSIANQIDPLLVYFINDEITAALSERGLLIELRDELIKENYKEEDFKRLEYAKKDLQNLFRNRTNFVIGSSLLDFTIGTYSAFEMHISDIYEDLIQKKPRSDKKEKQLINLIAEYHTAKSHDVQKEIIDKIKKLNFYLSGSEKIIYTLSQCSFDKATRNEWLDFINHYREQRNTIHNLGIHKGKSKSLSVNGIDIILDNNKPSTTPDFNSTFFACQKLMKMYEVIVCDIYQMRIF